MLRTLTSAAILSLVLAVAAEAGPLHLTGDAKPRHRAWVKEASARVPLPPITLTLVSGYDPRYFADLGVVMLPRPGSAGWTYAAERASLLHELGHAFDHEALSAAERRRFSSLFGTTCRWRARSCSTQSSWNGQTIALAPSEMFAEAYAACALGLTLRQILDARVLPTYGWEPPAGSDGEICALIRAA